ncbi:MAG: CRISPR/Cas system-associated exonuclease Cas4 (RecB family), partial [Algoriphagus sp.]
SGMYSFRNLSEFYTQNDISEKDLVEEVENVMAMLLTEMMDEKMPFMQTTELKNCEYCAFKTVCNR